MRRVQLYPYIENVHTAYKSLIETPPRGYVFVGAKIGTKKKILDYLSSHTIARGLYHLFVRLFKTLSLYTLLYTTKKIKDVDMIFSGGSLYNGNKKWVVDIIDHPYSLAGNNCDLFKKNKEKIEEILMRANCKKIICANITSLNIIKNIFSEDVAKKATLVWPAIKEISFKKKRINKDYIQMLFIGSINNPRDFYMKGGLEAIEVCEKLQTNNKTRLIIRCEIPSKLKNRVYNNPNIIVIENKIPYNKLIELYLDSDILLSPSHGFVLMSTLEAMSFGLPIVSLDTYSVGDFILDGYNGFLIPKSDQIKSYKDESYPTNLRTKGFLKEVKNVDKKLIDRIANKVELLIKDSKLREKMSRNGRTLIKNKFSIEKRNEILKKIFDEVTKNEKN